MYTSTFSGTEVLLGLGALCLLLLTATYILRRRLARAAPSIHDSRTKLAAADIFRYSPTIGRLSLCAAIFASFVTINWTQWEPTRRVYTGVIEVEEIIEQVPRTVPPKPEPPPPPPPPVIEPVPNQEAPTVELKNQAIDADEVVFAEEPVITKPTVAPPPPPAPPPMPPTGEETTFLFVERMPVFGEDCKELSGEERKQCSDRALLTYVQRHVRYPAMARENGVEGTVVVRFVVEKDGSISQVEAVREVPAGCTEEALRAVQRINADGLRFTPGIQAGRPVRVAFNLPIKFALND